VGKADTALNGRPHERQNRLSAGDSVAQEEHRTGSRSSVTVTENGGDYSHHAVFAHTLIGGGREQPEGYYKRWQ
jgi:hypothetical protein